MITRTVNNTTVTMPDRVVFEGDNNAIEFSAEHPCTALTCRVALNSDTTKYIECVSLGTHIVMALTDFIRATAAYNTDTQYYVTIVEIGGAIGNFVTTFKLQRGVTLPTRYHGSDTLIRIPWMYDTDPLAASVEIHSPIKTLAGPTLEAESMPIGIGVYNIPADEVPKTKVLPVIPENRAETYRYGLLWAYNVATHNTGINVAIDVITCLPKNGILLRYYNTDGCLRYAAGVVMSETLADEHTTYSSRVGVMMSPAHHVDDVKSTIKVGFMDVTEGEHLEDIMMSEEVWIVECGNAAMVDVARVVPSTLSIERDGETNDIVINFNTL